MPRSTAEAQLKNFSKSLAKKPKLDSAYKQKLKAEVLAEYNKVDFWASAKKLLQQRNYQMGLMLAGGIVVAAALLAVIQPALMNSGNGRIANNNSDSSSLPTSFPASSPELTDCLLELDSQDLQVAGQARTPNINIPFKFSYNSCEWDIETKENYLALTEKSSLDKLTLKTSEVKENELSLAACNESEFELTDFGARVRIGDKEFKYLRDFIKDSQSPTILCEAKFTALVKGSNYLGIEIIFTGENPYDADDIVDSIKLGGTVSVVDQLETVPPTSYQRIRLSQCNTSIEMPVSGGAYPFPGNPEKVGEGSRDLYNPLDYRGMYWKSELVEDPRFNGINIFSSEYRISLTHAEQVARNYAGIDGVTPGIIDIFCTSNKNLDQVVLRVENSFEEFSDISDGELKVSKKDTNYHNQDAVEMTIENSYFLKDDFKLIFIRTNSGVIMMNSDADDLNNTKQTVYKAFSVVSRDLARMRDSLEF